MRWRAGTLAALAWTAWPSGAAALGPGSLDPSFGERGVAVAVPGGRAADAVALPDGRVLVAGTVPDGTLAVARFAPDGRLDAGFGAGGVAFVPLAGATAAAVAVTPDGGAAVVGTAGDAALAAAALDVDGRVRWAVAHRLAGAASAARAVMRRAEGGWYVAGSTGPLGEPFLAVLRDGDGALDPAFAGRGWLVDTTPRTELGDPACSASPARFDALAPLPSGSVVAGGGLTRRCGQERTPVPLLGAWTPTGARDGGFAPDSIVLTAIRHLLPGPGGTVLAAGTVAPAFDAPAFARFTGAGARDDAFAVTIARGTGGPAGFALAREGRLVAGTPEGVVRLRADGRPDERFDEGGVRTAGLRERVAVAVQPDDRVVVAGAPRDGAGFALARLLGGTRFGRVTVGRTARVRGRRVRVVLTCGRTGPGCAGRVRVRSPGRVALGGRSFALAPGARRALPVTLVRRVRTLRSARVWVANPPAPALHRRVRLQVPSG